jgi:signal transduction histidine kinase/DNA-binding NarL/FixJ family response regulator
MKALVDALDKRLAIERKRRLEAEASLQSRSAELLAKTWELEKLGALQDRLIEQRTSELALARDAAVAASAAKSAFLANMSHEIRTPLTSIIGFAELLLEPDRGALDKLDSVRTIIRNGRHLLEVISDILDLAKIETEQVQLEHIDFPMPVLLRDLTALVSGRAVERSLDFVVQPSLPLPGTIRTDPVRLKQILLNFCSNAIKFTPQGSVTLELGYDVPRRTMTFTVADTGIGMTADQMDRLFQPFVQADVSTTRQFGGTGLGLYLSRQLAERLGGRVSVRSEPGTGSRFTLELPAGADDPAPELLTAEGDLIDYGRADFAITSTAVPDLDGQVLLAEDGLDNQRLLTAYLERTGLTVTLACNGREAVDKALAGRFGLVLMDIQMPVMDGITATRLLRASGYTGPIVALTANVMNADVQRYHEAGCNDVLAKPVDSEPFYRVVTSYFAPEVSAIPACGDEAYEREMATLAAEFCDGLEPRLLAIGRAAAAADWAALQALVHALKGTAGSYGFPALTEIAAAVDTHLSASRQRDASALCAELIAEGRRVAAQGRSARPPDSGRLTLNF